MGKKLDATFNTFHYSSSSLLLSSSSLLSLYFYYHHYTESVEEKMIVESCPIRPHWIIPVVQLLNTIMESFNIPQYCYQPMMVEWSAFCDVWQMWIAFITTWWIFNRTVLYTEWEKSATCLLICGLYVLLFSLVTLSAFLKNVASISHLVSFSLSRSCFRDFPNYTRPKHCDEQTFSRSCFWASTLAKAYNKISQKSEILSAERESPCYG